MILDNSMQLRDLIFITFSVFACLVGFYLVDSAETLPQLDHDLTENPQPNTEATDWTRVQISASVVPENMTVAEKKQRFKDLLTPAIDQVYLELDQQYMQVKTALEQGGVSEQIEQLKQEYRAQTDEQLLAALKPHPRSIVLAQAAIESAWGTSRFFVKAKNVFGVWSFNESEPRIAAGEQRGDTTIWLKQYDSIYESVKDNYRVLARGEAFEEFRSLRVETDNPYKLVMKLDKYSEKGEEYSLELASMISFNQFSRYDNVFYERN
jgi:Bax protein